jgi:hypothetical protein
MQGKKNWLSLCQHNFCVYGVLLEPLQDKPGTIKKSVRWVNVPKQYDHTVNF